MIGIHYTQCFLAPTSFVRKGLLWCGVKDEIIHIVPYGSYFELADKVRVIREPIRFIYVGQVTYRKGMHHLLKVFSELQNIGIELDVVGPYSYANDLYETYKNYSNMHFKGSVPHDQVSGYLNDADVFVFLFFAFTFNKL